MRTYLMLRHAMAAPATARTAQHGVASSIQEDQSVILRDETSVVSILVPTLITAN